METFATARDAKEFLFSRIVTESQLEGVPLSVVERKMLYFSETGWTLPDIDEVIEVFEHAYDQADYEGKVGKLVRNYIGRTRTANSAEFDSWKMAVQTIRREDHYLLVLINAPGGQPDAPLGRFLKLVAIALVIFCPIFLIGHLFLKN